jgi:hypothetical protein
LRWKYTASTSSSSADVCPLFSIDCAYTMFMPCWVPDLRSPSCASSSIVNINEKGSSEIFDPSDPATPPPYIKIATKGMTPAAHAGTTQSSPITAKQPSTNPVPSPLPSVAAQNVRRRRTRKARPVQKPHRRSRTDGTLVSRSNELGY